MKKNTSMQGTLNKLFGKKNANNNSLYANNPPWILPQGAKKASVDYHDEVHNSFAFLDDSGTATLKSRPGPRVRPTLHFSASHTDAQGLAVPTPSVPQGFTDNASMGNGSKLNGNYRMYSSVGDLHLHNNYDDYLEEIPAPPSMPPPPPPPTMAPPQTSPPSSAISSPSSPSPPDFIPPTPNSSAPMPPRYFPAAQSAVPTVEPHQTNNVAKWKSETVLNAVSKDLPLTLPNRFSLNPAGFQHNQEQINFDVDPRSTLPKSFKIPPPAPTRISSIQLQEPQNIGYSKDPPPSPVPSSFNPSFQAKLFTSRQGQQSLNDTLNKRKSMLIMEDLPDFSENTNQRIENSANITDSVGSMASSLKENTNVLHNPQVELNKESKNEDFINDNKMESASIFKEDLPKQPYRLNNTRSEFTSVVPANGEEGQKYSQNGTERNTLTLNKYGYTQGIHKFSNPTVKTISVKPIIDDLSFSNSNTSKHDSLTRKEMDIFPQELAKIDNAVKPERVEESPPMPPPMAPPPPPPMFAPPNPQSIAPLPLPVQNSTPPKTSPIINLAASPPPPPPPFDPAPVVRMPSPLLSPKPKTISVTPKPPSLVPSSPLPKAPPAPPPLPSSIGPSSSVSLQEALQAKQQTLRKIPESIEIRPAQTTSIPSVDGEQKVRVGKIKGELEALFSPKKGEKGVQLKNSRLGLEAKNSNGNDSHLKGGGNTLVNSLMLKVPLLPAKFEREDVDADNSEWLPKTNKVDIQIPEPDYLPTSPIRKTEKSTYAKSQNKIPKATLEISVPSLPVVSPQKDTNTVDELKSSIPTYKPHREIKISTESSTLDELPVVISKPDADISINLDSVPQRTEIATSEPSLKQGPSQAESTSKHPVAGEQAEANSPMALLMAAQRRAQKTKSLEKKNLPKISVTSGLITSSSASPYNERKTNTFVVVPNKQNLGQFNEEEVTSFTSNSFHNSDYSSVLSTSRHGALQSSDISSTLIRSSENPSLSYNSADVLVSTSNRHEEYLKPKSKAFDNYISTTVPNSTESPTFNISSFPSPIPNPRMDNDIEYEIIPPPAEFMNSPVASSSNLPRMQPEDRSYNFDYSTRLQSDRIPNYDRNNSIQPFGSISSTSNSGFNNYSSDNYSTALNRDSQRSSLIKKRLYMPEPESSRNYGLNTRSTAMPVSYSNMQVQSSSSMVPDPRRSNTTSRFLPQGRRVSSENIGRIIPPMTDMKYKSQNLDYSAGKSSTRSQSKLQQGMTFTVRPGTRQPISQMYQGGYL